MIHEVKLSDEYWGDVLSGRKTFELRKNDRNYQVGDYLWLKKVDDSLERCLVEIIYKLEHYVGLEEGYCILGIKLV